MAGILNMSTTVDPLTGEKIEAKRVNFNLDDIFTTTFASVTGDSNKTTFVFAAPNGTQQTTVKATLTAIQAGIVTASGSAGYASVPST